MMASMFCQAKRSWQSLSSEYTHLWGRHGFSLLTTSVCLCIKTVLIKMRLNHLKTWTGKRINVKTPKLKASSHGDYDLTIGKISTKHFDAREKLDKLYAGGLHARPTDFESGMHIA